MDPPAKERLRIRDYAWILSTNCIVFTSFQMLVPVLPLYVADGLGDEATVGLVVGALTFTALLLRPFLGWVIDQYGRKTVLIASIALFGAVGLSYPLATSLAALLVIRIVQGLG